MAKPESDAEVLRQLMSQYGGAGAQASTARVYMGQAFSDPDRDSRSSLMGGTADRRPVKVDTYLTEDDAKNRWYQMPDTERAALGVRMYRAGLISNPADYDSAQKAWNWAVGQAAGFTGAGRNMSPWAFIDMVEASGGGNSRGASQPRKTTATSTRINLPSKEDAAAVVKDIFNGAMGRDPDQGEIDRYASLLIAKARANPEKTTTTTNYNADGTQSNSSTVTSGGVGAAALQQAVLDKAKADPEYGAYQAATTFYNLVMQNVGAPV